MNSKPNGGRGLDAAKFFELFHHTLAAAVMASAVLALEQLHALDWLDAVMLRVVAPMRSEPAPSASAQDLQLVLIDGPTYANRFGMRSPLDREQLTGVVSDLLAARPASLLIDLQLEPAVGEGGERALDDLLKTASGETTQVVLPVPERRTPALDLSSVKWMRSLCSAGVVFGSAHVRSHFGAVIRFDEDRSSLASLAHPAAGAAQKHGHPQDQGDAGRDHRKPSLVRGQERGHDTVLCRLAEEGADLEAIWQMVLDAPENSSASEPLSPKAVRRVMAQKLIWQPEQTRLLLEANAPAVIVLGGDFDERDTFFTPASDGPIPGAAVHASSIASQGSIGSSHFAGWLVDVGIGTALGFLFSFLWKRVRSLTPSPDDAVKTVLLRSWGQLVCACGVWAIALGIGYGLMSAAGFLMEMGMWMNPGPVVLGMFLHALLVKNEALHHPHSWRAFTVLAPNWPIQALLIAGTLLWLLAHMFMH